MVRLEGFETLRSRQREEDGFSPVDMISHAHFCFHLLDQRSRAARLATVRHPRFRARRGSMGRIAGHPPREDDPMLPAANGSFG